MPLRWTLTGDGWFLVNKLDGRIFSLFKSGPDIPFGALERCAVREASGKSFVFVCVYRRSIQRAALS